ncbi:phosphatase PAP2 family protein [Patescibacteria group bacterium]
MINTIVFSDQGSLTITFLASILIWIMLGGLVVLWYVDGNIKKGLVIKALVASVIAWVISLIVKDLLGTTRPFGINGGPPLTITLPTGSSFPSSHAAFAFAIATVVWLYNRALGAVYLVAAVIIGIGRVVSNVHFPIDVVGGAMLGSFIAIVVDSIKFKKIFK